MSFLKRLFGKKDDQPKVTCPRCLGKGYVDEADIKRLKKELAWRPGDCAYCNGEGKVGEHLTTKIPADETYLTMDLPKKERKKLLNNNLEATLRAKEFNRSFGEFIAQIKTLHEEQGLDADQIAEQFLKDYPESSYDKAEWLDYIQTAIDHTN